MGQAERSLCLTKILKISRFERMSRENGIILAITSVVGLVAVAVSAGYPGFRLTPLSVFFFVAAGGVALFGKHRSKKPPTKAIHLHLETAGIKITKPANDDFISFLQVVSGTDGYWYLQRDVVVVGGDWSVQCQFDASETKSRGKPYKVVAATGREHSRQC
jgi:hypothetical protein